MPDLSVEPVWNLRSTVGSDGSWPSLSSSLFATCKVILTGVRPPEGFLTIILEPETESRREHPLTRQLLINRQRIQAIILVSYVQNADGQLRPPLKKAPTRLHIQLHQIVTREACRVAI